MAISLSIGKLAGRGKAKASGRQKAMVSPKEKSRLFLVKLAWVYLLLVIFEGALRKWFLPFLATPLLVVKDPFALWALYFASTKNWLPRSQLVKAVQFIGVIAFFLAITVGHGNLFVALFGARVLLIHFPFMFLMGHVLRKDDIIKMGNALLIIGILSTAVVAWQFESPQSAWINQGVGGDESGSGFSGSLGYSRVSGLFSFTNGNTLFYSLLCPFIFYFWLNTNLVKWKWLLIVASMAYIAAVPLSISRSLFFQTFLTGLFFAVFVGLNPKYTQRLLIGATGAVVAYFIVSQLSVFSVATEAFNHRFESANHVEGGVQGVLIDRFLGGMWSSLSSGSFSLFGMGIGLGTNVGAMLLAGQRIFLAGSEGEWGREIAELGILGFGFVFWRLATGFSIWRRSFQRLRKGDALPWLITSASFLWVIQAQLGQPTSLGFAVIGGGLTLGALNVSTIFRIPQNNRPIDNKRGQKQLSNLNKQLPT